MARSFEGEHRRKAQSTRGMEGRRGDGHAQPSERRTSRSARGSQKERPHYTKKSRMVGEVPREDPYAAAKRAWAKKQERLKQEKLKEEERRRAEKEKHEKTQEQRRERHLRCTARSRRGQPVMSERIMNMIERLQDS